METLASIAATRHTLPARFPVGLELACTRHGSAIEGLITLAPRSAERTDARPAIGPAADRVAVIVV